MPCWRTSPVSGSTIRTATPGMGRPIEPVCVPAVASPGARRPGTLTETTGAPRCSRSPPSVRSRRLLPGIRQPPVQLLRARQGQAQRPRTGPGAAAQVGLKKVGVPSGMVTPGVRESSPIDLRVERDSGGRRPSRAGEERRPEGDGVAEAVEEGQDAEHPVGRVPSDDDLRAHAWTLERMLAWVSMTPLGDSRCCRWRRRPSPAPRTPSTLRRGAAEPSRGARTTPGRRGQRQVPELRPTS